MHRVAQGRLAGNTGRVAENVLREIDRDAVMWEVDIGRSLVGTMQCVFFLSLYVCYAKGIESVWPAQFCGLAMTRDYRAHYFLCVRPRMSSLFSWPAICVAEAVIEGGGSKSGFPQRCAVCFRTTGQNPFTCRLPKHRISVLWLMD